MQISSRFLSKTISSVTYKVFSLVGTSIPVWSSKACAKWSMFITTCENHKNIDSSSEINSSQYEALSRARLLWTPERDRNCLPRFATSRMRGNELVPTCWNPKLAWNCRISLHSSRRDYLVSTTLTLKTEIICKKLAGSM